MTTTPAELLDFWFVEAGRRRWFAKDAGFDALVRRRFEVLLARAAEGGLDHWQAEPESSLALVILLDQFPRNMYRDRPRAYAHDGEARRGAGLAVERGHDRRAPLDRRFFFYLPFEHGEDAGDQRRSVALFRRWMEEHEGSGRARAEEQFLYVLRHQEIIERFGRFPHRNRILGRTSTPEEEAFLEEPKSLF